MNEQIFIEYDNTKLSKISDKIYNLFIQNNYQTELLNNSLSLNTKLNIINNSSNSFVLSNKINNSNNNAIEIIYPLRSTDELARNIANQLNNYDVTKYYQLRAVNNTILDYYEILRDINNNLGIIIKYGSNLLNDEQIPNIIFQAINNYLKEENIYTVKSGDSLYAIAKNFNTSVDEIKRLNNLTSNNLSLGQKLIIPNINNTNDNSNNNNNSSTNTYTVKSGDSLYAIARNFNTSVDELKRLNNLTSNNLSIGQKLIIPNTNNINSNSNISTNTYTVKSGDSLYAIARNFNTSVDELKRLNNLTSNNLSIGQKLIIPNNSSSNISTNTYTVKSGDSLYAIARNFSTSVDELKRLNNLTSNNLSIGQKLIIKKN